MCKWFFKPLNRIQHVLVQGFLGLGLLQLPKMWTWSSCLPVATGITDLFAQGLLLCTSFCQGHICSIDNKMVEYRWFAYVRILRIGYSRLGTLISKKSGNNARLFVWTELGADFFPTLGQSNLATSATNKQVIGHVGVPMGFIPTTNMGVSKFRDTPTAGS
jgi:hypothetical protein